MQINNNTHILITDISFSGNSESLNRLTKLGKCILIDHHEYYPGFFDGFENLKVHHNDSKSASLLCLEYFGLQGIDPLFDKLIGLIDVYKLWQTHDPRFNVAQNLNEYFLTKNIDDIFEKMVQNNFKLLPDFGPVVKGIQEQCAIDTADFESRGLIQRSGIISLLFIDEWFNQIMISEMLNGKVFVIGFNSYGIIKVRISADTWLDIDSLNRLRVQLTGTADVGHTRAFTYKMDTKVNFDNIMKEAEIIVKAINKII